MRSLVPSRFQSSAQSTADFDCAARPSRSQNSSTRHTFLPSNSWRRACPFLLRSPVADAPLCACQPDAGGCDGRGCTGRCGRTRGASGRAPTSGPRRSNPRPPAHRALATGETEHNRAPISRAGRVRALCRGLSSRADMCHGGSHHLEGRFESPSPWGSIDVHIQSSKGRVESVKVPPPPLPLPPLPPPT